MEKVIPPGINYADIKPEAIENQIKIIKFTPVQTGQFKGGDVVRFNIQGNGFYDPYSAYLKFTIGVDSSLFGAAGANNNNLNGLFLDRSGHSVINRLVIRSQGQELERIEEYDVIAAMINDIIYSQEQKMLHHFEGFGNFREQGSQLVQYNQGPKTAKSVGHVVDPSFAQPHQLSPLDLYLGYNKLTGDFKMENGVTNLPYIIQVNNGNLATARSVENTTLVTPLGDVSTLLEMQLCIPIYSGVIGVLMPDKKLLPLSLMPLEVEFTINPHAMYASDYMNKPRRAFYIKDFELYAHVLFFEQELHRSLEAVVAEHGIFIHFNTFRQAPVTANTGGSGSSILQYAQINSHAKSINSIHWVFLYDNYLSDTSVKKLQFMSHNLQQVQVRNGTELMPSEPIVGSFEAAPRNMKYSQFLVETYKAWGKMHDPMTDSCLNKLNYSIDTLQEFIGVDYTKALYDGLTNGTTYDVIMTMLMRRLLTPSCQYGISFEGEQLGSERSTITGKKGLIPFDINMIGKKTLKEASLMFIFVKADYILYVRPDLVVTRLGD